MHIKLSICIPTLNRGKFIGETLGSIIDQSVDGVEIVVVDGGSKDNTEDVIKSYQAKFGNIRYFRPADSASNQGLVAPSNKGFDQDCNRAIELAKGEYCWILPDDDVLKPNAIQAVLNQLDRGYSLILVNSELKNADLSAVIQNKILAIDENQVYPDLESFFKKSIQYISYVGSVVIDRNLWLARNRVNYFGTAFVHVGVIFQAPLPSPALIISEPYISARYSNAHWTSRAFEIGMVTYPTLIASFESISQKARNKYASLTPISGLITTAIYRAKKQYSLVEFRKFQHLSFSCAICRLLTFAIAVTPPNFIRFPVLYLAKILKKEKKILIYDLENS